MISPVDQMLNALDDVMKYYSYITVGKCRNELTCDFRLSLKRNESFYPFPENFEVTDIMIHGFQLLFYRDGEKDWNYKMINGGIFFNSALAESFEDGENIFVSVKYTPKEKTENL